MSIKEQLSDVELNEGLGDFFEKRWNDMKASMGKPGYAGGKGKEADNLRKDHPNAEEKSDWSYGANKGKYHAAAAVAAGLGALALAKKLRNKKKKASKKK